MADPLLGTVLDRRYRIGSVVARITPPNSANKISGTALLGARFKAKVDVRALVADALAT